MRQLISVIALILVTMNFTACGGNTGLALPDAGGVIQCRQSYDPIPKDLEPSDKISKVSWPNSGATDPSVDAGTYDYVSMEFFMIDTESTFKFHTSHVINAQGTYQVKRICGANATKVNEFQVAVDFPSKVIIAQGGKITSETKTMTIEASDRLKVDVSDAVSEDIPPSKVTEDQNFESQLYQTVNDKNETIFEYRFVDESGPIAKYVVVRYKKI